MTLKEFEKYLKEINPEIFSFSYVLVPDDLQAQQLVVDALYILSLEYGGLIAEVLKSKDDSKLSEVKKTLYKQVYTIGKKRFFHLKNGLKVDDKFRVFYMLELEQKAILFLKQKSSFEIDEISQILNLERHEVIAKLNSARKNVIENSGKKWESFVN